MSDFVKRNELEKLLNMYDRLGSAQTEAGISENRLRKYIDELMVRRDQELSKKFNEAVAIAQDKAAIEAKKAAQHAIVSVTVDLHKTFDGLVKKLKESLLSDLSSLTKIKTDEILKHATSTMTAMKADTQNFLGTKIEQLHYSLKTEQTEFQRVVGLQAVQAADSGVSEITTQINALVQKTLEAHTLNVDSLLKELRAYVTEQMNLKLVDKQAIEQKMREIEADLIKKTTSIIDFNVEQARAQMESSARAEVREGIKEAASQLISGIQ